MKAKLAAQAAIKYLLGVVFFGLLLFLPAGTLRYPGGRRLLLLLFLPMLLLGIALLLRAPELLEKRLRSRESQGTQQGVVALSGLMFMVGFVLAGLDFRFGWSQVPAWLVALSSVLFLAGYALYAEVLRENAYLSRTVEVQAGQKVIDTGLYGVLRHPLYFATLLLFLPLPLILGSYWALLPFLCYPPLIVLRLLNEERLLTRDLPGYAAYCRRVRWRLLPFVWKISPKERLWNSSNQGKPILRNTALHAWNPMHTT